MIDSPRTANDLHVHTSVSDGRLTPELVVLRAAERGIETLVITDHSAVTFTLAELLARRLGVSMPFPGIEVSAQMEGRRHHLLLYGTRLAVGSLPTALTQARDCKNAILAKAIARLRAKHPAIPQFSDILAGTCSGLHPTADKQMGSRSAAAAAISAASSLSFEQAHDALRTTVASLTTALPVSARYPAAVDVLAAAASLGVVACLAHPLWQCSDDNDVTELVGDLRLLAEHGLWAVATRSYHHRQLDDHPRLLAAVRCLRLALIGGSDFHGNGKTELGEDATEPAVLAELTELACRSRPGVL
jgi:3',5'-nucleoside bisphosphate phosphatase